MKHGQGNRGLTEDIKHIKYLLLLMPKHIGILKIIIQ